MKLYPTFHEYFRKWKPPLLAIWGKHDLYFIPAGADAFRHDNPNAIVQFLDTGHFALETHVEEIALAMRDFLQNLQHKCGLTNLRIFCVRALAHCRDFAVELLYGFSAEGSISYSDIVLVLGAWADGSDWKGVYDILVSDGYKVSIVQEPETSFKEDVAATRRVVARSHAVPRILRSRSASGAGCFHGAIAGAQLHRKLQSERIVPKK